MWVTKNPFEWNHSSVNSDLQSETDSGQVAIYNVNEGSIDDKFANSILHLNQLKQLGVGNFSFDSEIFKK